MSQKKDTGIVPELGITEDMRDALRKRDWSKPQSDPMENPANWTSLECKQKRFSGVRVNRLNGMTEIWVTGDLRVERKTTEVGNDPAILATMHEQAFETIGSIISADLPTKHLIVNSNPRGKRR